MERVSIFKPCDIEYPQYDKPVRYTEEFLKEIASNTIGCRLVEEHYGKSIGNISNITFTDGELFVYADSSESLQKFSPSFDNLTLVDEGDYFLATGGKLVEVASTVKPRLDNSKGGSEMGEEGKNKTQEFLAGEVDRLQKENAKLQLKIDSNKDKLDSVDEMEKELQELRDWKEKNSKVLEEQKPIIEQFKAEREKAHEELLEKASKGNAQIKEQLKNCDNETLETIIGIHTEEQPAKGVGADNAPGLDEGSGENDKETQRKEEQEAVRKMFPELNNKEE